VKPGRPRVRDVAVAGDSERMGKSVMGFVVCEG
jgi:hypothetical protein